MQIVRRKDDRNARFVPFYRDFWIPFAPCREVVHVELKMPYRTGTGGQCLSTVLLPRGEKLCPAAPWIIYQLQQQHHHVDWK
jgi:hypothetical protein